jgi:predicted nucleic acid-binding protein
MQIVLNSSPLIFLSKLGYLNQFAESSDNFYIPQSVANEIGAKLAPASQTIQTLINSGNLQIRASNLTPLVNSLNQRLGKGESEAIALGIELNADYVLLDDSAARREARRLGLNVRGTLAVIKKLNKDGKISIESLDDLYQRLMEIEFRVKRSLFDQIFSDDIA